MSFVTSVLLHNITQELGNTDNWLDPACSPAQDVDPR